MYLLMHRWRRRQWARRQRVWDIRHWPHCIFIEQSRFKLHHTNGGDRCEGGRVMGTLVSAYREQIVMSVHLSSDELDFTIVVKLIVLEGTMNQQVYRCMLQLSLLPGARVTSQNNFVLVPHTRATRDFLENRNVGRFKSPDMNPIEHLWEKIAVHIHGRDNPPTTAAVTCGCAAVLGWLDAYWA